MIRARARATLFPEPPTNSQPKTHQWQNSFECSIASITSILKSSSSAMYSWRRRRGQREATKECVGGGRRGGGRGQGAGELRRDSRGATAAAEGCGWSLRRARSAGTSGKPGRWRSSTVSGILLALT